MTKSTEKLVQKILKMLQNIKNWKAVPPSQRQIAKMLGHKNHSHIGILIRTLHGQYTRPTLCVQGENNKLRDNKRRVYRLRSVQKGDSRKVS